VSEPRKTEQATEAVEHGLDKVERAGQLESGRVRHPFELLVLALSLLMLPAVLIQDSNAGSPWNQLADGLAGLVWLVFLVELVFTFRIARSRKRALRAHWQDLVVVVLIFPAWAPLFGAFGSGWLRGWRLARLAAIVARLFRAERLLSQRRNFAYVAATTALIVVSAALAVAETDPSRFPNPGRGLWWAIETVTTVGYGDYVPASAAGRVVASFLMIVGIGFLGLTTAAIATHFVSTDAEDKHRRTSDKQQKILGHQDEIVARLKQLDERMARIERRG
jgi:voltage-gated potassium channel